MKLKKGKLFNIEYDVLGGSYATLVAVGISASDIISYIDKETTRKLSDEEIELIKTVDEPMINGKAITLERNETVLFLKHRPNNPERIGALAHEAFHITTFILDSIGVRLSDDSDEIYAYMIHHIVSSVLKKL